MLKWHKKALSYDYMMQVDKFFKLKLKFNQNKYFTFKD